MSLPKRCKRCDLVGMEPEKVHELFQVWHLCKRNGVSNFREGICIHIFPSSLIKKKSYWSATINQGQTKTNQGDRKTKKSTT